MVHINNLGINEISMYVVCTVLTELPTNKFTKLYPFFILSYTMFNVYWYNPPPPSFHDQLLYIVTRHSPMCYLHTLLLSQDVI